MASLRPSSPSEGASSPTTWLSPRSKLKALLATADSSSDEEADPTKTADGQASAGPKPRAATTPSSEVSRRNADESSDDDDDIVRPRGRLAARMAANNDKVSSAAPAQADDARERVRAILAAEEYARNADGQAIEARLDVAGSPNGGEEDMARPKKGLVKGRRSGTPDQDDAEPTGSPGLFVSPAPQQPSAMAEEGRLGEDSDQDLPSAPFKNERFMALVARKREERKAREAEEAQKRADRLARQQEQDLANDSSDGGVSDITDDDGGRKLTQDASRPVRKASKKVLEEMNRETQRMTRSLQLAHEAKTRKKITKASLFERFNFKTAGQKTAEATPAPGLSSPATPVSAHQTDAEMRDVDTPPSSPPTLGKAKAEVSAAAAGMQPRNQDATFHAEDVAAVQRVDKGKGKAIDAPLDENNGGKGPTVKRELRVRLPPVTAHTVAIDSDDDELEITVTKKTKVDALFDRVPVSRNREPGAMRVLRHLAHLNSPERRRSSKKDEKTGMTASELEATLQQRARMQAKLERDRRLELLRSKGVHILTAEEHEREMAQVEDIVARARQEAEELMQREKEEAKKERLETGGTEADPLAWDDSDEEGDGEYRAPEELSDIEPSGSEDEGEGSEAAGDNGSNAEEEGEDEDTAENAAKSGLVDDQASLADEPADGEEDDDDLEMAAEDGNADVPLRHRGRSQRKKAVAILSDDEDEEDEPHQVEATPRPKSTFPKSPAVNSDSPSVPTSVLRSATKPFIPGLPVPVAGPAGMGLTQIFAGTMDDSQLEPAAGSPAEPMPTFDNFPDSNFSQTAGEQADGLIPNSQQQGTQGSPTQQRETQAVQLHVSQSQMHGLDSLLRQDMDATQLSELFEPTQDAGFHNYSPLKSRFVDPPPSTVETVLLASGQPDKEAEEGPRPAQKTGRLVRRADLVPAAFEEDAEKAGDGEAAAEEASDEDEFGFGTTKSAFGMLRAAAAKEARKAADAFDKKKSKAKEMVDEQAEESEDEYAGLGGADGEDSADDDDAASVKEMIDDDEAKNNAVDDAKLAAFYADGERARDEQQVEKLFRDITSGMMRRKRAHGGGGDYDLSDSDDGGEARRRMKRRQFARMQKALFADERIEKIAENPRNQAFLRTIEDRGSDDEDGGADAMDFVMESPPVAMMMTAAVAGQASGGGSLDQSQGSAIPDSQPTAAGRGDSTNRRRTRMAAGKRPSSLGEIRQSLSTLLDEPNPSVIPATDVGSDGSDADRDVERHQDHHHSHKHHRADSSSTLNATDKENAPSRRKGAGVSIVDRISLKRQDSSSAYSTTSESSTTSRGHGPAHQRLAFAAASNDGTFKVPALLRRATTNSLVSNASNSSSSSSVAAGAAGDASARVTVGRGGGGGAGKRSGVNYFARENERRAALAEGEKRREARRWKGVEGRAKVVGGLFGGGRFE